MAWFTYSCSEHGEFKVSLNKREKTQSCPVCTQDSANVIVIGTARVVEVIDNGIMPRRVEWLKDIKEITEERDRKFSKKVRTDD